MELSTTIMRVKQALTSRWYGSEAAAREAIALSVVRALGWDDFDPDRAMGEHAPACRRVDSVRSASVARPALFIGAGKPGEGAAGGERWLSEQAFNEGRPLAVLTNGREWSFYLPAGQDPYDERLFYKLDLLHKLDLAEREPGRVIEQLTRRSDFERVLRSRQALDDARRDYNGLHGSRSSGRASGSLGATR
jgi:predicted type IV restriction endonuclease